MMAINSMTRQPATAGDASEEKDVINEFVQQLAPQSQGAELAVVFEPGWAKTGVASDESISKIWDMSYNEPLSQDPLRSPLLALCRALTSRELSATELVRLTLQRIEHTESTLQAHVTVLGEQALRDAAFADSLSAEVISTRPLHGLPVAVKDIIDIEGLPTKCGSNARHDATAAVADAPVVAALRAAGAIVISKTVTQEFAAGVVSAPARHPWDPARVPGGSSGGSAIACSVGAAVLALGSDTGGSIRIPAAVCGVAGLKPTYGRVSRRGVFPLAWSLDTVGPLARTVADTAMGFLTLDGYDPDDPGSRAVVPQNEHDWKPVFHPTDQSRPITGVRIGFSRDFFLDRVQADIVAAFDASLTELESLGATVIEVPWPEALSARAAAMIINRVETGGVHAEGVATRGADYGRELRLRVNAAEQLSAVVYLRAMQARLRAKREMASRFHEHSLDVFVAPTLPATAVRADCLWVDWEDGVRETVGAAHTRLTQPFNATGQPVLSLPWGVDRLGLPIGLQIAGRPDDEATVCRVGVALERATATPWHKKQPTVLSTLPSP